MRVLGALGGYLWQPAILYFRDTSVNEKENVEWHPLVGFQKYVRDIERDVVKIALITALAILYPPKGNRDNYCTAIAGVLKNHTEWTANEINQFVYNIAYLSDKDENAGGKMAKGTNAYNDKTKNFGLPKLAEILNCSVGAVAKLFDELGPRYKDRPGGYLRVIKSGLRNGDKAPSAQIEFVDRLEEVEIDEVVEEVTS